MMSVSTTTTASTSPILRGVAQLARESRTVADVSTVAPHTDDAALQEAASSEWNRLAAARQVGQEDHLHLLAPLERKAGNDDLSVLGDGCVTANGFHRAFSQF
jgi:hypothetical protein